MTISCRLASVWSLFSYLFNFNHHCGLTLWLTLLGAIGTLKQ